MIVSWPGAGGGGGAVTSVNGQTGAVVIEPGVDTSIEDETDLVAASASVGDTKLWYNTTSLTLEFWELVSDAVTADTPGEFRRVDASTGWIRRGVT